MMPYIKKFSEILISDISSVGGKNASLGEMYSKLAVKGVPVPNGFAVTSFAFEAFLTRNELHKSLYDILVKLNRKDYSNLPQTGAKIRELFLKAQMPLDVKQAIINAYKKLGDDNDVAVAVRSSSTAEDLPQASFAGQHESYLNISGEEDVVKAVQKCFASLYTDRAIKYREDNGFMHDKVSLSVGIQKMVRSDKGSSGVGFTLEPESGFRDIIHISGVWGLGENIVQGTVIPDEYYVFKPTLLLNKDAVIKRKLGAKEKTMIYGTDHQTPIINILTPKEKQNQFVLDNDEITLLSKWAIIIEDHYGKPMDFEWAKDGITNQLFIIQARPETVKSKDNPLKITEFRVVGNPVAICKGEAIGSKIAIGKARILKSPAEASRLLPGEILVTELTSPDWDPILKIAAAIITDKGGRTSHASIVARELGVPAVVGCNNATANITDGMLITVSCCEGKTGFVYNGKVEYNESEIDFSKIKKPLGTEVMLIAADPDKAFELSFYPNDGIGLLRIEFIITHLVQVHPMALVKYSEIIDSEVKKKIDEITLHYPSKELFFVDRLAESIATFAAAFYPKDVIVRMSDFKTNEYANLIGGKAFEPHEENPMLGFRGASRYYHDAYREGFRLECEAVARVRNQMGLTNVKVMIPFCRTVEEGNKVIAIMKRYSLEQGVNNLEIYVMAELPSNILMAEKFAQIFDGFSIGSNDLTQLILGIDRDSTIIKELFNEQNEAVEQMISTVIKKAKQCGIKIGLCGQAPSDYPQFARFLVKQGIDSISFNRDALLQGIENINIAESEISIIG